MPTKFENLTREYPLPYTKVVVCEQTATESALTSEASLLQESLAKADADVQGLFSKVERAASHAQNKTIAASDFGEAAVQVLKGARRVWNIRTSNRSSMNSSLNLIEDPKDHFAMASIQSLCLKFA